MFDDLTAQHYLAQKGYAKAMKSFENDEVLKQTFVEVCCDKNLCDKLFKVFAMEQHVINYTNGMETLQKILDFLPSEKVKELHNDMTIYANNSYSYHLAWDDLINCLNKKLHNKFFRAPNPFANLLDAMKIVFNNQTATDLPSPDKIRQNLESDRILKLLFHKTRKYAEKIYHSREAISDSSTVSISEELILKKDLYSNLSEKDPFADKFFQTFKRHFLKAGIDDEFLIVSELGKYIDERYQYMAKLNALPEKHSNIRLK